MPLEFRVELADNRADTHTPHLTLPNIGDNELVHFGMDGQNPTLDEPAIYTVPTDRSAMIRIINNPKLALGEMAHLFEGSDDLEIESVNDILLYRHEIGLIFLGHNRGGETMGSLAAELGGTTATQSQFQQELADGQSGGTASDKAVQLLRDAGLLR